MDMENNTVILSSTQTINISTCHKWINTWMKVVFSIGKSLNIITETYTICRCSVYVLAYVTYVCVWPGESVSVCECVFGTILYILYVYGLI